MIKHFVTFLAISALFFILMSSCSSRKLPPVTHKTDSLLISSTWVADQRNGTFKNPILHADYSDPDVIRAGDDYFMTASSFNFMPGLPILHSKDLVNWKLVNYALQKQEPTAFYDIPQHGKGIWAPSMNFHKGEYRIYYPDPDFGIFMVKTKNPVGRWEQPVLILKGKGIIDPSVFWDDDGKAYLAVAWAGSRAGVNSLLTVFQMNDEGTTVLDEGKNVYTGHGHHHTVEGPKFYKRNGFYYLFAPAGGVATGWQLVLRSKNIYGPYEEKIVMDQGTTDINGPHQGALVQTQRGEDWFFHFQDKGAYGRVVHLQPVVWKNDWPIIGSDQDGDGKGEPVHTFRKPAVGKVYPTVTPPESDEFNGSALGLQWQWQSNPKVQWSANIPGSGYLRLFAFPAPKGADNLWLVPNLLLQKFPAPDFSATTKVKWNTEWDVFETKKVGLLIMGNDYAYLSISRDGSGYLVSQMSCIDAAQGIKEKIVAQVRLLVQEVYLRVTVTGPDANCRFSFSEDGLNFKPIGAPFLAKPDKWTGARVGLFATSGEAVRIGGYADVDWFRIAKIKN